MLERESKNLEYKVEISNSFLKTISAFANYGKGKILFGVNDTGKIIGLKGDLKEVCLNIENKINDNIEPALEYNLEIDEKNRIIILEVFEGDFKPYLYKGKAYKRADSATVPLERLEYNRLILEGMNKNYEEIKAENQKLEFSILENELIKKIKIEKIDLNILKTLNLYSEKEGYNKVAEYIADKNFSVGIDIVKFGKDFDEFIYREQVENISVISQFTEVLKIFRRYYISEQIIGTERKTVEKISEKAFREVLANSLVHRELDIKVPIRISMYEDKIEIVSPGGLPNGISKEEYLNGQLSVLRNPVLSNVFFRLKYIEKFGTGIKRIKKIYEKNLSKPKFQIFKNSISVTLPILNESIEILTKEEQVVLTLLRNRGNLGRLELEKELGLNKDKLIRILNSLLKNNIIQRVGSGRSIRYKI